ncbi:hypothetical protein ABEY43_06110 [Priestia megaterium]
MINKDKLIDILMENYRKGVRDGYNSLLEGFKTAESNGVKQMSVEECIGIINEAIKLAEEDYSQ